MDLTSESFSILIVLLPGFLSMTVLNAITVRQDRDNLIKLFEALAFSFLAYGSTAFVVSLIPQLVAGQSPGSEASAFLLDGGGRAQIALMLGFALFYPIAIGTFITHDWHMKFLRKVRVTNKTARATMWSDVFTEQSHRYLVANLKDGTRILGWPMYYSDTPEEGSVYLYEPEWIDDNGNNIPMKRHGILIKKEVIESIEFTREVS